MLEVQQRLQGSRAASSRQRVHGVDDMPEEGLLCCGSERAWNRSSTNELLSSGLVRLYRGEYKDDMGII